MTKRNVNQPEAHKDIIARWLRTFGFDVTEESTPGALWALIAREQRPNIDLPEDWQPWGFAVAREPQREDRMVIQSGYSIEAHFISQLDNLSRADRLELLWDIRMHLLLFEVGFWGVDDPLRVINFTLPMFNESLTKTNLHDSIFRIRNAYSWASWRLQREFSGALPVPGGPSFFIN